MQLLYIEILLASSWEPSLLLETKIQKEQAIIRRSVNIIVDVTSISSERPEEEDSNEN